MEIITKCRDC
jgi:transposase InsO family protein